MVCPLSRTPSDTKAFLKQLQKSSYPHGDEALRNNINHTLKMVGNLGSHPSVIRFMKVIYELNKPQPKYTLIWEVPWLPQNVNPSREAKLKGTTIENSNVNFIGNMSTGTVNFLTIIEWYTDVTAHRLLVTRWRYGQADQTEQQHL